MTATVSAPGVREIQYGEILDHGDGKKFYVLGSEQVRDGYSQEDLFYRPFCSYEEIDRIHNIKSVDDYLLYLRADVVADRTRILRVVLSRMRKAGVEWNFSTSFSDQHFEEYLKQVPRGLRRSARRVGKGYLFDTEPYGKIAKTQHGELILITESMFWFLYFMNLSTVNFGGSDIVPDDVMQHAEIVGIRTMLGSEAQDFELDPRGVVPKTIHDKNMHICMEQLYFIIGHEYAHYFLGHLSSGNVVEQHIAPSSNVSYQLYTTMQEQEIEADKYSISSLRVGNAILAERVYYAMLYFMYVSLFEQVSNQLYPPKAKALTHPDPLDRIAQLASAFRGHAHTSFQNDVESLIKIATNRKSYLQEIVATDPDLFEKYASVYLGQWRGKPLIDRVDY